MHVYASPFSHRTEELLILVGISVCSLNGSGLHYNGPEGADGKLGN